MHHLHSFRANLHVSEAETSKNTGSPVRATSGPNAKNMALAPCSRICQNSGPVAEFAKIRGGSSQSVGSWQLAVGSWQLAVGSWQRRPRACGASGPGARPPIEHRNGCSTSRAVARIWLAAQPPWDQSENRGLMNCRISCANLPNPRGHRSSSRWGSLIAKATLSF